MISKKTKKITGYWAPTEGGYETTRSPDLIGLSLAGLKKKRGFVTLLHQGYQSGNTIIIDYTKKFLLIDKPLDWPGRSARLRVVFKDEYSVWNHFTVTVVGAAKDTLKTTFPTELFRLQRRSHFRIDVPMGCTASFSKDESYYSDAEIANISVGGMMIYLKRKVPLLQDPLKNSVRNITATCAAGPDDDNGGQKIFTVLNGSIVRETQDPETNRLIVGIEFIPMPNEEEKLLKYVRQRELEVLRRGIKE